MAQPDPRKITFKHPSPGWKNQGVEPREEFKESGYVAGYKPPAAFFNWFWTLVSNGLSELQDVLKIYADANESDKAALREAVQQRLLKTDFSKEKVRDLLNEVSGLNADTVDGKHAADFAASGHVHPVASVITPGFLTPAEKLSIVQGESHRLNRNNPHAVSKEQLGLGNLDDTPDDEKKVALSRQIYNNGSAAAKPLNVYVRTIVAATDANGIFNLGERNANSTDDIMLAAIGDSGVTSPRSYSLEGTAWGGRWGAVLKNSSNATVGNRTMRVQMMRVYA